MVPSVRCQTLDLSSGLGLRVLSSDPVPAKKKEKKKIGTYIYIKGTKILLTSLTE